MTIIAVSSILLASLGGAEMVFAQGSDHIDAEATIQQDNLPTITFGDGSLTVTLNNDGEGSVRLSDLISSTVTIDNQGSNVIQFILDPDNVTLSPRNPNAAGVVDGTPFQIPSFQTGVHTVVYNKTHFTFNFDDPTFSGTTPNVILQANIQSDADTLPAIHEDKANIAFVITGAPMICEGNRGATDFSFGTLELNAESTDGTVVIENTGTVPINVDIGGDPWCPEAGDGCINEATDPDTLNRLVMIPSRTHFSETPNVAYATKTAFTDFDYDTSPLARPTDNLDLPLFSSPLAINDENTAYLQINIELIPESDGSISRFTGDLTQEIWFVYSCSSP